MSSTKLMISATITWFPGLPDPAFGIPLILSGIVHGPYSMGSVAGKGHSMYARRAHHAGSWYDDNPQELRQMLNSNLEVAKTPQSDRSLRAVIVPHAGYSYSGPTAAYSYKVIQQELSKQKIKQILVLHPSHHVYLEGCAVSGAHELETPLGNLTVDEELKQELIHLGCSIMNRHDDEREHSGEMQYPYLALLKERCGYEFTVTPVMCGALSTTQESVWGQRLTQIIDRPSVLVVVSSDFCHWGSRFSFQPMPSNGYTVHAFIEQLDRQGMDLIERKEPGAFAQYLKETKNTICGRHAIAVWLRSLEQSNSTLEVKFIRYAQSNPVKSTRESSVSYAAAVAFECNEEQNQIQKCN